MPLPDQDPSFVRAIESRYLATVQRGAGESDHRSTLETAVYEADPTNGGLRYKALSPSLRGDLETRLARYRPV